MSAQKPCRLYEFSRNTLAPHRWRCVTRRKTSADWSSASYGGRLVSVSAKILPYMSRTGPGGPMGAQASSRSSDHWQLRMMKLPALRPSHVLAPYTAPSHPWMTRLWRLYLPHGGSNSMSVNTTSESTHQSSSVSGCASISARSSGSFVQNPDISASSTVLL
ncbi:Os03g0305950 [Oryza sativa Japonica Group]|uniref:Os03g0305950 protein n=2 Tax=Oryza sativa subsp. japonica TaxID=39947 RepID=C7IZN9_ORYSJ|nr:hypothetical protein EE612_016948 [Oryza sativa]BAH92116.1 Os03g0306200 [Oryza sativa Japonica Group]BAS83810.1 Os03g0305950 [Oryza sativa Japonica Group]|eukprot:NP_001173388.1 Os03g0306200 [Oryza sativa Japonica Group]